jgi:hypothetical protein
MQQLVWLAIVWVGGTAAILGSLMALGSLLLWLVPNPKNLKTSVAVWQRLKLLGVALCLTLLGLGLLGFVPFPAV